VSVNDIAALNQVFTTAFTDRYRKDGLVGTHVPNLSAAVWRFAIEDAAQGAMLWRGERDEVIGFNMVHQSGVEGWMGPLALDPSYHGHGIGKSIVQEGQRWLERSGAEVIGLETMPRTMDNIGFYSSLDFVPGALTVTLTVESRYAETRYPWLSRVPEGERVDLLARCGLLLRDLAPGYDFAREILLTDALALGDTVILLRGASIDGFALCHTVPLVEGRAREEVRVLKLVARTVDDALTLIAQVADYARRCAAQRVAVRVQGVYRDLYRQLLARGARVRWTDLRMTAFGYDERLPTDGVVLSNWEI
jgi:GNAT superfamily N-acetyltransferase